MAELLDPRIETILSLIDKHVEEPLALELSSFIEDISALLVAAPASSKIAYHHAYPGGLVKHILEVFSIAKALADGLIEYHFALTEGCAFVDKCTVADREHHIWPGVINDGNILTVAILHDIHKVMDAATNEQYQENILKSGAVSEKIPYKINKECFAFTELKERLTTAGKPGGGSGRALNWLFENKKLSIKNGGLKSLALLAGIAPNLLEHLSDIEKEAIEFHGGAYETSKFELAGTENPLTIIFHCADMLSSRFGATK